jgi:hypothetical protein
VDQRALVVRLETPLSEYSGDDATVREVLLAGLCWPADTPSGYWQSLAVDWIAQGATVDAEIIELVEVIAMTVKFPQKLRHKARTIARRWQNA